MLTRHLGNLSRNFAKEASPSCRCEGSSGSARKAGRAVSDRFTEGGVGIESMFFFVCVLPKYFTRFMIMLYLSVNSMDHFVSAVVLMLYVHCKSKDVLAAHAPVKLLKIGLLV